MVRGTVGDEGPAQVEQLYGIGRVLRLSCCSFFRREPYSKGSPAWDSKSANTSNKSSFLIGNSYGCK